MRLPCAQLGARRPESATIQPSGAGPGPRGIATAPATVPIPLIGRHARNCRIGGATSDFESPQKHAKDRPLERAGIRGIDA